MKMITRRIALEDAAPLALAFVHGVAIARCRARVSA
jgi:hypothetical protein